MISPLDSDSSSSDSDPSVADLTAVGGRGGGRAGIIVSHTAWYSFFFFKTRTYNQLVQEEELAVRLEQVVVLLVLSSALQAICKLK